MTYPPSRRPKLKVVPKRKNDNPEERVQMAMVEYLDLALPPGCGVFWSATLNGIRVSAHLRAKLRAMGVRPGVFDLVFVVLWDVGDLRAGDTYWIEVKSATGQPTPEQKVIMAALWPKGRGAYARSVEQLAAALSAWGVPLRAYPEARRCG